MKNNVCYVITNPMIAANRSAEVTLSKFLRVISAVYDEIHVVGGNLTVESDVKVILHTWDISRAKSKAKRLADIVLLQIKMASHVIWKVSRNIPVYFWIGDKMLLPFIAARCKRADIRYFVYGNVLKEGRASKASRISGKMIAWMANQANSVCVESPGVLLEWNGLIRGENCRCIHLYNEQSERSVCAEKKPVIGMLCRLTEGKHILESIEAFCEFHKKNPYYKMEIIGSGRQEQMCRELIAEKDAAQFIHMLGWVEHKEIPEAIKQWKYLLFPTDTEGMPNSVLEAMGIGIPAVASPVGGLRDLIRHDENGWILRDTTKEGILDGLNYAVAADSDYERVSTAAYDTICDSFSFKKAQSNAQENCKIN